MLLNFNGKILRDDELLISPDNRSFKYGDGCFETMRTSNGKIVLDVFHFERLLSSLDTLQFDVTDHFTTAFLRDQIIDLANRNSHAKLARARLTAFRGNGGLYDAENSFPNYIIQTWALDEAANSLNEDGLVIDIYRDARKVCDGFSHIKSNNFLPYAMAAFWAKKNRLNDALLLNPYGRIADATIANIFIVKDGMIKTPSLAEGAINGTMRRHLLQCLRRENMPVEEAEIGVDEVFQASEIFLTNAIQGIRWVKRLGLNNYQNTLSSLLHEKFIRPLFEE